MTFNFILILIVMTTNLYSQIPTSLTTQRINFEKVTKDHKSYLSQILCNAQVQEVYNTVDKESFTNIEAQFSIIDEQWKKYGYGLYILFNIETSDFIGFAGYHTIIVNKEDKVDFNSNEANDLEIYIILMPQHWNKGYGFEVARKLGEVAIEHLQFSSIIVYTEPKNTASMALIKKFNCTKEKEVMYNNKPHILYRFTKLNQQILK